MEGSNTPAAPSAEDFAKLQQMAEQALKTAEEAKAEGKSKAEQQQAAAATIQEESEAQGMGTMTDEQANMIASATITQLEQRGAFGEAPELASSAPAPPMPVPGPQSEQRPAAEGEGEPEGGPVEEAPRRKSLAERFQGK